MADKVFQNNAGLAAVLEDKIFHSDIEDGSDGSAPVGIIPPWRSVHMASILYALDLMAQAQATHAKTIETNKIMYKRSQRRHARVVGGAVGVARDWPMDCYDEAYWKGLSKFEQDTISKVSKVGIEEIADKLSGHCGKGRQTGSSGPAEQGSSSRAQKRPQAPIPEGTPVVDEGRMIEAPPGPSGSMHVD